jgi:leucine-rich repeat kinase 2
MAVRNYTENKQDKIEVWIGSGLSDDCHGLSDNYHGQVSWVNLTDRGNEVIRKTIFSSRWNRLIKYYDLKFFKGCQGTVLRDKRVKCMVAVGRDLVLVGTQSGTIWVFDALSHKCLHNLQPLPDSVVALRHYSNIKCNQDIVIGGLADGQLVIYQTKDLMNQQASRQMIQLCQKVEDGGQCTDDCTNHSVACLAIAQKSVFCGCGNDVVVLKLEKKIELRRRWSIEDTRKGLVRNIAVGSYIWTSTKDSPLIDFWDTSQPVLRGTVNCKAIMTESGFEGESRVIRVVCMMLHGQNALWIGLGTGHIILLSPSTRETLCILNRHSSSVRCMAIARTPALCRPVSLIVTGGMGFIQRPGCNRKKAKGEFGHVLVWEADLGEQVRRLNTDHHKRHQEPLFVNMASMP